MIAASSHLRIELNMVESKFQKSVKMRRVIEPVLHSGNVF